MFFCILLHVILDSPYLKIFYITFSMKKITKIQFNLYGNTVLEFLLKIFKHTIVGIIFRCNFHVFLIYIYSFVLDPVIVIPDPHMCFMVDLYLHVYK